MTRMRQGQNNNKKKNDNEKERNPTREEKIFIFIYSDFDIAYRAAFQKCWTLCCPGAINFVFSEDILRLTGAEPFIKHCIMTSTCRRCNDDSLERPTARSETEGKVILLSSSQKRALSRDTMTPLRVTMQKSVDGMFAGCISIQFNAIFFNSNEIQGNDEQKGCPMAYSPAQGENIWSIQQFLVIWLLVQFHSILTTGILIREIICISHMTYLQRFSICLTLRPLMSFIVDVPHR